VLAIDKKVMNNKTEDAIYCYSNTFVYGDDAQEVIVNNHLTKLDIISMVRFEAGKNIPLSKMEQSEQKRYAILYNHTNGVKKAVVNCSYKEVMSRLKSNDNIGFSGAIIFSMDDCEEYKNRAMGIFKSILEGADKKIKDCYTISEFSKIIGVTAQTLRNWELTKLKNKME
jgi:hypothetical protein